MNTNPRFGAVTLKEMKKILKDCTTNKAGDYSSTKIGTFLSLILMLSIIAKIGFFDSELFLNHLVDITILIVSLTGGRKVLESWSDKIRGFK
jgi:hypothetical protein